MGVAARVSSFGTRLFVVAMAAGWLVTAVPADAHVNTDPEQSTVQPDGQARVQFAFDHGCDGQPTTSLRVQIPDGVTDVVPEPIDGWQTSVDRAEFAWTGGSVPDGERATFVATMRVSGEEGQSIWFPAVQGCPTAEEAWIEIPTANGAEPTSPAPGLVLPQTIEPPPTTPATAVADTAPSTTRTTLVPGEAAVTEEGSPRNNAGLVVGLVAVGAVLAGAAALYVRYRGRGNTGP